MKGWRPALRLAWRDAWKAKGRSILVLVMITLPVLAITAAAVIQRTADVDSIDGLPRTLGSAEARITPMGGRVMQTPDPDEASGQMTSGERPTLADFDAVLGDREVITIAKGFAEVPLGDRRLEVIPTEVDLRNPLTEGMFALGSGDLPGTPGEVVINDAYAERGVEIGDTLDVLGEDVTVVGIGRDATYRDALSIIGPPGSFGLDFTGNGEGTEWLVGGDPLLWPDVLEINQEGGVVRSRAVLLDPPPVREQAEELGYDTGYEGYLTVVALIVTMALLEVVLLAGPAFAVGARRQARTLALMAASGGTPRQARRVVLASGVVLGAVAALLGAVLGVLLGLALLPVVQTFSNQWFGPIEVNWPAVVVVAAFGLLSAFLAAVVPAWLASRQDVVAVLSGRRGDPPPSARTPVLGVVLLGIGIALSVFGVKGGEFAIALGAVVAVFGMIFIVPLVVGVIARLSGRLPLVMRYAARDAARHRTRTVPAIAAVAATVAGVVALGIANSSDEAQNRESYQPTLAMGAATVGVYADYNPNTSERTLPPDDVWDSIDAAISERLPDESVEVLRGQRPELPDGKDISFEVLSDESEPMYGSWGGAPSNAMTLVSDGPVPGILDVDASQRTAITAALESGRAVVFTQSTVEADEVTVRTYTYSMDSDDATRDSYTWPALFVASPTQVPVQLLLPTALAEETGVAITPVGYYLGDADISEADEKDLNETLGGIWEQASMYVERGYQAPDEIFILLLVLFTLGGVLMLGGTLTATFLALSDARPDLATLSAVGAAPRSRRGVAASYALVVGFVGAILGALVGFIPGVAITYPLTSQNMGVCATNASGMFECETSGPFLDIPWSMILALVILLPLLTAAIVGLTARSRLPLAARLT